MPRAVLDTNVLGSGFVGLPREQSTPDELLRRWILGQFTLVVSEILLSELEHAVFADTYFRQRIGLEQSQNILLMLRAIATVVDLKVTVQGVAPDPDDDHILAAAANGQASFIVTGDKPLQSLGSFRDIEIVTPREFLELLEDSNLA